MKRNKRLAWLVAAVMLFSTFGFSPVLASDLQDVPPNHWAYNAVQLVLERGYMALYDDGTFQGTRTVDRYALAAVVARVLNDIESGLVEGSLDDLELLQELTTEFREELVQWYAQRDDFEQKLAEAQRSTVVTDERLNRVTASHVELQEAVQLLRLELMTEAAELQEEMKAQRLVLDAHSSSLAEYGQWFTAFDEDMDLVQQALFQLEDELLTQRSALDELENWAGEKGAVFGIMEAWNEELWQATGRLERDLAASQQDLNTLVQQMDGLIRTIASDDGNLIRTVEDHRAKLDSLVTRTQELERDLQNVAVRLNRETDSRAALEKDLDALNEQIANLELQVGLSEEELAALSRKISDEISVQMNTALIREQRLERQLQELEEDFNVFKANAESTHRSLRTQAIIAMVIGAVGIAVGFIGN